MNPERVKLGLMVLEGVAAVAVTRSAAREVVEWGEQGRQVALADVSRERVEVVVKQELGRDDLGGPALGTAATLSVVTGVGASDAARRTLTAAVVVLGTAVELVRKNGGWSGVRTIRLIAVGDGATDPVVLTDGAAA